jgi:hypothetical protein
MSGGDRAMFADLPQVNISERDGMVDKRAGSGPVWVTNPVTAGQNIQVWDGSAFKYIALNNLTP